MFSKDSGIIALSAFGPMWVVSVIMLFYGERMESMYDAKDTDSATGEKNG